MRVRGRHLLASAAGVILVAVLTTSTATSFASSAQAPSPVGPTVACSTVIASGPTLGQVETHFASGLLTPFGVAIGSDGKHAFVDSLINPTAPQSGSNPMRDESGISEYSISSSGGLASERIGPVSDGPLLGMAVSPNGRELVAAGASGASVFSVSRIEQAGSAPSSWLVGTLTSHGQGAIEAAVSPDGHYVFVSLEDSDQLAVFNLGKAERSGFGHTDLVGYVPMGVAPVGMTISPDGRYLYATSEAATESGTQGTLTTVNLRRAEERPSDSVVSTVWAGCSPVRVVATESSVYVTARESWASSGLTDIQHQGHGPRGIGPCQSQRVPPHCRFRPLQCQRRYLEPGRCRSGWKITAARGVCRGRRLPTGHGSEPSRDRRHHQ